MQVPSEVSAEAGDAAMLPCTFTHPHRHYDGPLTAIWRAGEPYAGPQVFRCTAARGSELCQTALSLQGRFRLLGNPRRNDLSLRVERLALADSGRYFCRVEFAGDAHDRYESRHGVRLRVTAAPRIVNISVLPGPAHAFRALCTAEGEPPPALSWSGPALGNSSAAAKSQGHGYQVTAELPTLTRDGRYTCTAANSLGRAEASVYLFRFRGAPGASTLALLLGALGLKALLLLGVLGARATHRRLGGCAPDLGGDKGEDRSSLPFLADHPAWSIRGHPDPPGSAQFLLCLEPRRPDLLEALCSVEGEALQSSVLFAESHRW
ncbi:Sialic acid-binding Ig-like lectin 15 [Lemmus lemmus]